MRGGGCGRLLLLVARLRPCATPTHPPGRPAGLAGCARARGPYVFKRRFTVSGTTRARILRILFTVYDYPLKDHTTVTAPRAGAADLAAAWFPRFRSCPVVSRRVWSSSGFPQASFIAAHTRPKIRLRRASPGFVAPTGRSGPSWVLLGTLGWAGCWWRPGGWRPARSRFLNAVKRSSVEQVGVGRAGPPPTHRDVRTVPQVPRPTTVDRLPHL